MPAECWCVLCLQYRGIYAAAIFNPFCLPWEYLPFSPCRRCYACCCAGAFSATGVPDRFAGTNGYHTGEAPDKRAVFVAKQNGIDISKQFCRQLTDEDFNRFDLILAMDQNNLMTINRLAPLNSSAVTGLFTAVARDGFDGCTADRGEEIPDPYYGDVQDFERAYEMVREAAEALADRLV